MTWLNNILPRRQLSTKAEYEKERKKVTALERHDHENCFEVSKDDYIPFNGLRLDTCANCTLFISFEQYRAYCQTYTLAYLIKPGKNRDIAEIGGTAKAVGLVVIQVLLENLDVVIDVALPDLKEYKPTVCSMKNMLQICFDIYIQRHI